MNRKMSALVTVVRDLLMFSPIVEYGILIIKI